jgi:DNA-binding SARP family transcriptional activator
MPDRLHVSLSGRVGVWRDGVLHELAGRHPPSLFAQLALARQRVVPRTELCRALWGEEPPDSWQPSLRVSLSKVRAFLVGAGLGAQALSSRAGGYQLLLGDVVIDAEQAAASLHVAETAREGGDAERTGRAAATARAAFDEPFLPGAEGPWVDEQRRLWAGALVRALELEAAACSDVGTAIAAAERAVSLDPYRESAHRALIRACAAAGNKADALRRYERCREILAEDLGVDPAPATQALHMQVLRDEPFVRAYASAPSGGLGGRPAGLDAGREALVQRRWPEAFELLARLDAEQGLEPADLEALGEAAAWTGHHAESIAARQRAYSGFLDAGEKRAAARAALAIASNHGIRSELPQAGGWAQTAAGLLEGEAEGPEHGFLAFVGAMVHFEGGRLTECHEHAHRVREIGRRFGIEDLTALGCTLEGMVLAHEERMDEAIPLLDEAMALVTSGRVSPVAAGTVYCRSIRLWLDAFDFRRAAEWVETVEQCATRIGFGGNPGDCEAHLATALVARGSWTEAERRANRACEHCSTYELSHVGLASNTLGEIHLRRGELEAAELAFARAHELGVVPQPGLAQLQLERGDARGALTSVQASLASVVSRLRRAAMLPAAVDIAIAAGDVDGARGAAAELGEIVAGYRSTALHAAAAYTRALIALHDDEAAVSLRDLRTAVDGFRAAEMPYELARSRGLLGEALHAMGDGMGALMELQAARDLFVRLGARPHADAASRRLEELRLARTSRERP